MASIRKRSWKTASGERRVAWQVDFIDQDGNRHQPQFSRRVDADNWLIDARTKVQAGTYTPDATSATIGDAVELWFNRAIAEGLEAGTLQQYRQHRAHILAVIDDRTKLSRLTQPRCEQVRDDLLKAHSRDMARKVLQSFKAAIKDAKRRGLVTSNQAAETTIGSNGRHKRKLTAGRDFPMPAEVKQLIDAADLKAKAMVCLAGLAGLRASELRALMWAHLDLGAKPTVTIEQRADRWSRIGSPKSATSRRTVPVGERTVRALKEWRLAQPPGRALVFGTASDKPDMLGNLQRRLLSPLQVRAGIVEPVVDGTGKLVLDDTGKPKMQAKYSWHALRHYAISAWLKTCGGNFKLVQTWAGHGTLSQTLDRYGHLIPHPDDYGLIALAEQDLQ